MPDAAHLDAAPRHEAHADVAVALVTQLRRRGVEGLRWAEFGGCQVVSLVD